MTFFGKRRGKSVKIIDLSLPIENGMYMPKAYWHPEVAFSVLGVHEKEGRMSRKIQLGTHTGTHVDAALHFLPNGATIDEAPLERLIGEAQLIDVSFVGPRQAIKAADLERGCKSGIKCSRVVIRTGWVERAWGTDVFGKDKPYFTKESIQWLLDHNINLMLIDTGDPDSDDDFVVGKPAPIHVMIFENDVTLIENVTNLDKLPEFFKIIALPLKLKGCDAAPGRVIAIVD